MSTPLILTTKTLKTTLSLAATPIPTLTLHHPANPAPILQATIHGLPDASPTAKTIHDDHTPIAHKLVYPTGAVVEIKLNPPKFSIHISAPDANHIRLAVPIRPAKWFGLGQILYQHWPLELSSLHMGPVYPFDNGPTGICTLVEPTFYNTAGAAMVVDDSSTCLHLSLNAPEPVPLKWGVGIVNFDRKILPEPDQGLGDGLLTVMSRTAFDYKFVQHPWKVPGGDKVPTLHFDLFAETNVKQACQAVLRQLAASGPGVIPPEKMMRDPIWSTWAKYKDAVTQSDVLQLAKYVVDKDLPRSIMGIDDRWSSKYGDLHFDPVKFPDPTAMIAQLHDMGFLVTLWVTPFANTDSKAVTNPETRKFFVHNKSGQLGDFAWWQPTRVAALDVTNPSAVAWFVGELQRLRDAHGLDGFKFDAGEPSFLPKDSILQDTMSCPADYTRAWIRQVASKFPVSEVRSGVRGCQGSAPMFRLFDKFSSWGLQNGLASVLAGLLTTGILGYPFCIPDYIAGNAYGGEEPDAELMIRWAQASCAMPAMQFSIPPWDMGAECDALCAACLQWRKAFFWDKIEACIQEAAADYTPIARPMWWAEPERDDVAAIYDQFMIGDGVVVAPVLNAGQRKRDVFLPSGLWHRVQLRDGSFQDDGVVGPVWLQQVSAELDEMPTYVCSR